jgi:hypothetical protein
VRTASLGAFDNDVARDYGADVIVLDATGHGAAYAVRQRLLRDRSLAQVPLVAVTADVAEAQLLRRAGALHHPGAAALVAGGRVMR